MTALALRAPRLDPVHEVPVMVISKWVQRAWEGDLPQDLQEWWGEKGGDVKAKAQRMNGVKGPLGAVIHHLKQIGWDMESPTVLLDRGGDPYDLTMCSPQWVIGRIRWDAREGSWGKSAETRTDAKGLEGGWT